VDPMPVRAMPGVPKPGFRVDVRLMTLILIYIWNNMDI
jgi:hypothetical protein